MLRDCLCCHRIRRGYDGWLWLVDVVPYIWSAALLHGASDLILLQLRTVSKDSLKRMERLTGYAKLSDWSFYAVPPGWMNENGNDMVDNVGPVG